MGESDERRDDERRDDEQEETPEWNTPEIEVATDDEDDELPIAVRRVLASDQHLSQRRVFYGQAGEDEDEEPTEPENEDETPR